MITLNSWLVITVASTKILHDCWVASHKLNLAVPKLYEGKDDLLEIVQDL